MIALRVRDASRVVRWSRPLFSDLSVCSLQAFFKRLTAALRCVYVNDQGQSRHVPINNHVLTVAI